MQYNQYHRVNIRLSMYEIESISKVNKNIFGDNSKVYLFGSRTDDTQKGGDIDLYIETPDKEDLQKKKIDFLIKLEKLIGEQKIDIIFNKDKNRLIEIEAKTKGIELDIDKIRLQKYFNECDKHIQRINEAYNDINEALPISSQKYQNLTKDQVQDIDQYLFRFSKLQDTMGDKIFKLIIKQYEENSTTLPFIDILNKLEKLGFINNAKEWLSLRKAGNEVSHQYDDEPEEMSQAINNIFNQKTIIIETYDNIKNRYYKEFFLAK